MKLLKENPITRELHNLWRSLITSELNIDFTYLSSIHYVNKVPEKFYLQEAFNTYYEFLITANKSDHIVLQNIINESEHQLDSANSDLNKINEFTIHDIMLPDSEIELINFTDTTVHFNLLKLYESSLLTFLRIVAKYNRIKSGKGTDGLDLFNVIDDLKDGPFSFVSPAYRHIIRNGIAHGKVFFKENRILYSDKKGNNELVSSREVVKLFDHMIDINNGLCLAFKAFLFSNITFVNNSAPIIPRSMLVDELKTICKSPGWEVLNSFESLTIDNKKQLSIYVKNANWDINKVSWYCFFTAYWAESLTEGYERFFISLSSTRSLPGWAAFNANTLKELRKNNTNNLHEYFSALEDGLIMFIPKHKFPRFIYKLGSYRNAFLTSLSLLREKRKQKSNIRIDIRDSHFHSKGSCIVIADSSVVFASKKTKTDVINFIAKDYRDVMNQVFRYTKKQLSFFSVQKYLPVKYARVFIYDSDMRIRNLRYSGLIPELVAVIELNVSKQIKSVDLINCELEHKGKYKIYWHRNWRGSKDSQ